MSKVIIREPIWKTRSVGIRKSLFRIEDHVTIQISYRQKDGELWDDNTYTISKKKASTYPTQTVKGGVVLYIVPIEDLEIVNENNTVA